jgi:hypothetical protein
MNLPAHQTIDITPDEERQLDGIHREFISTMRELTPKQQLARASVWAGGVRKADPLTRALAQQIVDVDTLNREASAAQEEIDFINSSQRRLGRGPTPIELARREALQQQVEQARARQLGIMERDFSTARRKAAVEFRERAARQANEAKLAESIARQTAEAEQAAIDARAAAIVRGKRLGAGNPPSRAGEAQ